VLDNFPSLKMVALVGEGEPLMHKRFYEMVGIAKKRGIRVSTISNGSAFSQSVVKKICESGLDYISISIDSVDPETFAQSRIDGDLNKVWVGIERLAKYRNENGFKYPVIGLKGTLFTHTRDEMPRILSEAKEHGVDVVEAFQPLNPKKSYMNIYPPDKAALLDDYNDINARIQEGYASGILPSVLEFAQREQLQISSAGTRNPLRKNCDEEWIYSLLSGDVTPCCQIKDPVDPAWNIANHPLQEILKNEAYENMRFNLWNGLFLSDCEGCSKTF
jgi:MoaA/NifB/PqqE/SkfB family radical SAM enzyme